MTEVPLQDANFPLAQLCKAAGIYEPFSTAPELDALTGCFPDTFILITCLNKAIIMLKHPASKKPHSPAK